MKIKRFFAKDMRTAMTEVKEVLGPDAVIMSNKKVVGGIEIVAAVDYQAEQTELQKNAISCGWTVYSSESAITAADVDGYTKSGFECPKGSGKLPEKKEIPSVKTPEQIKADLLTNAKKCGWGDDVKAYEASGWKCDSKMDVGFQAALLHMQNQLDQDYPWKP